MLCPLTSPTTGKVISSSYSRQPHGEIVMHALERPNVIIKIDIIVATCLGLGKVAVFQQIPHARIE